MKATERNYRPPILIPFFFILFFCILASINEIQLNSVSQFGRCALSKPQFNSPNSSSPNFLAENSSSNDIRILLGILTHPKQFHRRHFLRLIYGTQSPVPGAKVDVKFVFCNLTTEDQKVLVALEIMRYDDIMILNCTENMDKGKTFTYFSSLPDVLKEEDMPYPPYDYVLKADDDTYFRLGNLVESLKVLPREDLFFGHAIPHNRHPYKQYMSGMGYLVSWDIVEWIRVSDIPKNHTDGPEDRLVNQWLRDGNRGKNWIDARCSMYNYPDPSWCTTEEIELSPTVAVHLLKNQEKWIHTLSYFNVTKDLKPSKLYHIS